MSLYMNKRVAVHPEAEFKPIGYWLKHLHNLIEAQFDAVLAATGLTRRHWQVLNTLSRSAASAGRLDEALAPFRGEPGPDVESVLTGPGGLIERDWARRDPATDEYALTDTGRTAHAALAEQTTDSRTELLRGITPQQYTETVRVLAAMAANAEAALAA